MMDHASARDCETFCSVHPRMQAGMYGAVLLRGGRGLLTLVGFRCWPWGEGEGGRERAGWCWASRRDAIFSSLCRCGCCF